MGLYPSKCIVCFSPFMWLSDGPQVCSNCSGSRYENGSSKIDFSSMDFSNILCDFCDKWCNKLEIKCICFDCQNKEIASENNPELYNSLKEIIKTKDELITFLKFEVERLKSDALIKNFSQNITDTLLVRDQNDNIVESKPLTIHRP